MSIILGSLLVELKANTAQFLDGMTKASTNARAFGRDIQRELGKAGELFAPLGEIGEKISLVFNVAGSSTRRFLSEISKVGALEAGFFGLVGATTALGGGLFALADHAAEMGNKVFEASEKTGIAADQMSGLMALAKETGTNFDGLTSAMGKAGVNIEKAILNPLSETGKLLAQVLGGAKGLDDEKSKSVGDRIQDVTKHIFALHDAAQRNVLLAAVFGKAWQDNVAVLELLADQGFAPAIAAADRMGYHFGPEAAKQAHEFKVAMAELSGELAGVGLAIGEKALPHFKSFTVQLAGWIPTIKEYGERLQAISLLMIGNFSGATAHWKAAGDDAKSATQAMTDLQVRMGSLAGGEKAAADAGNDLASTFTRHADALADLILRERDQLSALNSTSRPVQALREEYSRTMEEIQKAVAAGGNFAESLKAQALAADIFAKKLTQLKPLLPSLPDVGPYLGDLDKKHPFNAADFPQLGGAPSLPASTFAPQSVPQGTWLTDLKAAAQQMDSTRGFDKAMQEQNELSSASVQKLIKAFEGLNTSMVASSASGRKFVEELTRLDKVGTLSDQLNELRDSLVLEGEQFGSALVKTFGGAIDQVEDKLAQLAVKGRVNFRELGQSLEQSVIKAGLQKTVGSLLSVKGLGSAGKPDGSSAGKALFVRFADEIGKGVTGMGGGIKGVFGAKESGAGDGGEDQGPMGGATGDLEKMVSGLGQRIEGAVGFIGKEIQSIGGFFAHIFGGFLAGGGDTEGHKAYVVGEKGPEVFVPHKSGSVVPSLGEFLSHGGVERVMRASPAEPFLSPAAMENFNRRLTSLTAPAVNVRNTFSPQIHNHLHVHTPDADNFKRSESQIMANMAHQMNRALARNR